MKLIALLLLLPVTAGACPSGTEPFKGVCVDSNAQPYLADPVQPSDEKPPSDKMPSYQREGVTPVTRPNTLDEDIKLDREKAEADAEGKRAAGIK